jgi:catechol 2,3-dioxygenase-like lactoylglutathione lyase family enzyme
MFHYITLGSNDIARSGRFYDAVLATLGIGRHVTHDEELGYGPLPIPASGPDSHLWVVRPFLALPATWGNGTMIALPAPTRAAVSAFHAAALANGGSDEGAPGLRTYRPNFYACYVRDPDGNKLSAVCEAAEG